MLTPFSVAPKRNIKNELQVLQHTHSNDSTIIYMLETATATQQLRPTEKLTDMDNAMESTSQKKDLKGEWC